LAEVNETKIFLINENKTFLKRLKLEITLTESWVVVLLCARYNDFAVKRQFCWKPRHFVAVLRSDLVTLSRKNGFISIEYLHLPISKNMGIRKNEKWDVTNIEPALLWKLNNTVKYEKPGRT
jgi:hypothetical protein